MNKKTIAQLFRYAFANHRRSMVVRGAHRVAEEILYSCANCSTNIKLNGELRVLKILGKNLNGAVFDVGANKGSWALCANQFAVHSDIHCFEPIQDTFHQLERNLKGQTNDKVILNNFGLSDQTSEVEMNYDSHSNTTASITQFHENTTVEICEFQRGDEYAASKGIDNIAFLKLDVEGAEMSVLEGFSTLFDSQAITTVQFEYGRVNILTKNLLRDFYTFFEDRGYSIGAIYPRYVDFRPYDLKDENFVTPNFLAVANDKPDLIEQLR